MAINSFTNSQCFVQIAITYGTNYGGNAYNILAISNLCCVEK